MNTETRPPESGGDLENKIHDFIMKIFAVVTALIWGLFTCSRVVPATSYFGTAAVLIITVFTVIFTAMAVFAKTPAVRRKSGIKMLIGIVASLPFIGWAMLM